MTVPIRTETTSEAKRRVVEFFARKKKLFIGGEWVDAASSETFAIENPANGQVISHVAHGDQADMDAAAKAARRAFEGPWAKLSPMERTRLMLKLADAIEANAAEIALLETYDVGQPLWFSNAGVAGSPDVLRYFAGWASKISGETMTPLMPGNWHAYTTREPVGVVGLILPWNSPFTMAVTKVASLMAAGCTTVIKPAEEAPLSTIRFAELVQEVGFPDGVVNLVTGFGETAGAALIVHPSVDKISFTGSTETGKLILRQSADTMKRVTLELGGKSPVIILPDADLDRAIEAAAGGIFLNSGQICVAGSRLYAHKSVFKRVVDGIVDRAQKLRVGPGDNPETQMGPLVSKTQLDRVCGFIASGKEDGAEVATGGARIGKEGYFVQPTVLLNVKPDTAVIQKEIFGPVLCASSFDDEALDAVAREANSTIYGLAANIWTRDISAAHKLAKAISAGTIKINSREFPETSMPFGGFKQSGIGRERGRVGVEIYTELKSVMVAL